MLKNEEIVYVDGDYDLDNDPEYIAFEQRRGSPYDYCIKHDGGMETSTWERNGVIEKCSCCENERIKRLGLFLATCIHKKTKRNVNRIILHIIQK